MLFFEPPSTGPGPIVNAVRKPDGTLLPVTQPMYFVQGPREVVMILTSFDDVRHVHLADTQTQNGKPSWCSESTANYEGRRHDTNR